jgi:glucan biosynthesis protein
MLRTLNLFCDSPVKQRIYDQLSVKGFLNLVVFVLLVSWTNLVNAQTTIPKADGKAFSHDTVVEIARKLSQKPFIEPKQAPEALTKID